MNYQKQWVQRDDNVEGFVYLMEAVGYHGVIPGCFLRRCKIGLSRNPQKRLEDFHSNQPPCDIKIIKSIFVEDMTIVEGELHAQFKHCSVKLLRSKEWFDFNPLQFWLVLQAFNLYEKPRFNFTLAMPSRLVIASILSLIGTSLLFHSASLSPKPIKVIPTPTITSLTTHRLQHKIKRTTGKIKIAY